MKRRTLRRVSSLLRPMLGSNDRRRPERRHASFFSQTAAGRARPAVRSEGHRSGRDKASIGESASGMGMLLRSRASTELITQRDEQNDDAADQKSTTSSQATARPQSSKSDKSDDTVDKPSRTSRRKVIHAIGTPHHAPGKATPVLLRDHYHAEDPVTPPHSTESKGRGEAELNLDLSELGLEDSMIKPSQLHKLEKIGSGGFKE